jgi:ectoine hydroxylase-related dioxygenase (phytanoyl-CoA dioxygenase family)
MNRRPLRSIRDEEIRAYEEDGVICLPGMFDQEWCERMRAATHRLMESGHGFRAITQKPGEQGRFFSTVQMHQRDPDFLALRDESPAAEIGATLMRVDAVRFYYDQLFVKEPGTSALTHWHQDLPYWPFRGAHIVSVWIALTKVDLASSGVEYLLGSHRWDKFYRATTTDEDPAFTNPDLEPCPDFSARRGEPDLRFRSWDMEPGDVLCHHPLTVHGAGGNASTRLRVGVSLRFFGTDVQWDPRPYTLKLGRPGAVSPGAYPDDELFPVVFRRPPPQPCG